MVETRIFGWVATTLNLLYKFPQIIHLYRTKNAGGLSVHALYIQSISYVFLLVHGILIHDIPVMLMGFVSGLQVLMIVILYHRCPNKVVKLETGKGH